MTKEKKLIKLEVDIGIAEAGMSIANPFKKMKKETKIKLKGGQLK